MFHFCAKILFFFFFNDTATTEIYTLSLHDALPISAGSSTTDSNGTCPRSTIPPPRSEEHTSELQSHVNLVCRLLLEKKKQKAIDHARLQADIGNQRQVSNGKDGKPGRKHVARLFVKDTATTEIYTLSLHDALPI